MDIALAIEVLIPSAEYFGSTTKNTKSEFDALVWNDSRQKPTWTAISNAYADLPDSIKNPVKP
jgi:hypothetical protein